MTYRVAFPSLFLVALSACSAGGNAVGENGGSTNSGPAGSGGSSQSGGSNQGATAGSSNAGTNNGATAGAGGNVAGNAGNAGNAGEGGSNAGSGGNAGNAGSGGSNAGASGSSGNSGSSGTSGSSGNSGSSGMSGSAGNAGGLQDAPPESGDGCVLAPLDPNGPLERQCAAPTDNECDGNHDTNNTLPNGQYGNGFDDDCDGEVDEGCPCDPDHPTGTTKPCWLVPASQADPGTHEPVGYCNPNAKGTMACIAANGQRIWSGYCKGAQFPYADDSCGPGDYDCDGVAQNPHFDCSCDGDIEVTCPTEPVTIGPFPRANDLTYNKANPGQPFIINGWDWISDNVQAQATQWKWTVTGGDCDNILPHPTFAVFNGANTGSASRVGTQNNSLGSNGVQHGIVVGPFDQAHQIYPAFSLSGDYTVQGDFDLGGQHYTCTVKVQVRAPGLRTELCWDTVGNNDVDLHLGRLQGGSGSPHGWCEAGNGNDDCYYADTKPNWGYGTSNDDACVGWGSKGGSPCSNPRLDKDNISCSTNETDPGTTNLFTQFCGPENINLDNPNAGEQSLVAAHAYDISSAHPHINVYCNGERKLAMGYDPILSPNKPSMSASGNACVGDFWIAARIKWTGQADNPCDIEPIPSNNPNGNDGSTNFCVDNHSSTDHQFNPNGSYPTSPATAANLICGH